ncbi:MULTISPECIES: Rha family transcriptional regulator [Bacillus]|uniref:Rha family transcriptional regulator n=1 Tax=Bacillus TaxID=1386 RepID=UPI002242FF1D|nr:MULTISPECIES: Rha family transcriptional regulator [Bacillus]MDN5389844.1 Rha family transcriptional regulator [Bacillus sp. LB7]MEC1023787.1 Rha family transcriptional regulator [Bacillus paralicheniformis]MEC1026637.1 Rha family transcriptional regulator [Bacillus paralicheniformis]MEC1037053.1 Rha family transcriptional regulator [Bacillus paralicheniformis]MEC1052410.1 Rha family transcriptional regulator [Bacillus paralicheniformis]
MENQLVFNKENIAVTDSLIIAETFDKQHKDVLRDIRIQMDYAGEEFSQRNFAPSNYEVRGKQYPKYDLTEEAFTLVVFGYNTKEAVQTKIKFIQEFKRMKEYIQNQQQPKAMNAKESILANMKLTIQLNEDVDGMKEDIKQLRHDMDKKLTLDYSQQQAMRNAVNKRVHKLWNEDMVDKKNYETTRRVYAALWKNLKDAYRVNAYPNILQKDFEEAMSFIEGWRPIFNGSQSA